jgi:hypothetical protein
MIVVRVAVAIDDEKGCIESVVLNRRRQVFIVRRFTGSTNAQQKVRISQHWRADKR